LDKINEKIYLGEKKEFSEIEDEEYKEIEIDDLDSKYEQYSQNFNFIDKIKEENLKNSFDYQNFLNGFF
jgi:trans-2-enoyl-CoA reductase